VEFKPCRSVSDSPHIRYIKSSLKHSLNVFQAGHERNSICKSVTKTTFKIVIQRLLCPTTDQLEDPYLHAQRRLPRRLLRLGLLRQAQPSIPSATLRPSLLLPHRCKVILEHRLRRRFRHWPCRRRSTPKGSTMSSSATPVPTTFATPKSL